MSQSSSSQMMPQEIKDLIARNQQLEAALAAAEDVLQDNQDSDKDVGIRLSCVDLAIRWGDLNVDVVETASAYYEFIMGGAEKNEPEPDSDGRYSDESNEFTLPSS